MVIATATIISTLISITSILSRYSSRYSEFSDKSANGYVCVYLIEYNTYVLGDPPVHLSPFAHLESGLLARRIRRRIPGMQARTPSSVSLCVACKTAPSF